MARTYDEMVKIVREARPDLAGEVKVSELSVFLDQHFPLDERSWRTVPLQEGQKLLREVIAGGEL